MSRINKNSSFEAILRSSNFQLQQDLIVDLMDRVELDKGYVPCESYIKSIVEDGLTSESLKVREKSFRLVQLLYHRKILRQNRWNEVQVAIIGLIKEIFENDNSNLSYDKSLAAALGLLCALENNLLIIFFIENISTIQRCFTIFDPSLRFTSVIGLGKLLLKVISLLDDSTELDIMMKVASKSDSVKSKEDFLDSCIDILKTFAKGITGSGPKELNDLNNSDSKLAVTYNLFEGYSELIVSLLCMYNSNFQNTLTVWVESLLGISQPNNSHKRSKQFFHLRIYVTVVLNILLEDGFTLKAQYLQYSTSQVYSSLVSQVILALLQELPSNHSTSLTSMCILNVNSCKSIFSLISNDSDDSADSRQSSNGVINIIQFSKEWVQNSLIGNIGFDNCVFSYIKLVESIHITQHKLLLDTRLAVAPKIFLALNNIMTQNEDKSIDEFHIKYEIAAWTVFISKYLSNEIYVPSISSLLKIIATGLTDNIKVTSLVSEICNDILMRYNDRTCSSSRILFQILDSSWICSLLTALEKTKQQVPPFRSLSLLTKHENNIKYVANTENLQLFKYRLLTAIYRICSKLIPVVAFKVNQICVLVNQNIAACHNNELNNLNKYFLCLSERKRALYEVIGMSLIAIKFGFKCLLWSTDSICGDAAAVSLSNLMIALSIILSPVMSKTGTIIQEEMVIPSWAICIHDHETTDYNSSEIESQYCELYTFALEFKTTFLMIIDHFFITDGSFQNILSETVKQNLILLVIFNLKLLYDEFKFKSVTENLINILQKVIFLESYRRKQLVNINIADAQYKENHYSYLFDTKLYYLNMLKQLALSSKSIDIIKECKLICTALKSILENDFLMKFKNNNQIPLSSNLIEYTENLLSLQLQFPDFMFNAITQILEDLSSTNTTVTTLTEKLCLISPSAYHLSFRELFSKKILSYPSIQNKYIEHSISLLLSTLFRVSDSPGKNIFNHEPYHSNCGNIFIIQKSNSDDERESLPLQSVYCSDIFAIIDRVLPPHIKDLNIHSLNSWNAQNISLSSLSEDNLTESDETNNTLNYDDYVSSNFILSLTTLNDKKWKQINGSGDIVTLKVNFQYDMGSNECDFNVRIFNSSGFQIDTFTVQICIRYSNIDSIYENGSFNNCDLCVPPSTFCFFSDSNKIKNYKQNDFEILLQSETVKYFDLNSVRDFNWKFQMIPSFTSFSILTKVIYHDMRLENDLNGYLYPHPCNVNETATFCDPHLPSVDVAHDNMSDDNDCGVKEDQGNSLKLLFKLENTEVCYLPFHVGIIYQLIPYGSNVISTQYLNRKDKQTNSPIGGIPWYVYLNLWEKLRINCVESIQVGFDKRFLYAALLDKSKHNKISDTTKFSASQISKQLINLIDCSILSDITNLCNESSEPICRLGILSRVKCSPNYESFESQENDDSAISVLIWCFQTQSDNEIVVKLSIKVTHNKDANTFPWTIQSWVDLRASDKCVMSIIVNDLFNLMHDLSGRFVTVDKPK